MSRPPRNGRSGSRVSGCRSVRHSPGYWRTGIGNAGALDVGGSFTAFLQTDALIHKQTDTSYLPIALLAVSTMSAHGCAAVELTVPPYRPCPRDRLYSLP